MKILLIRHGKPEIVNHYSYFQIISGADLSRLTIAYGNSALDSRSLPSVVLLKRASQVTRAFSSSAPRAIETARKLQFGCEVIQDDLFREAMPPHGFWPNVRMPCFLWPPIARLQWLLGISPNAESNKSVRERALHAARKLQVEAREHGTIALVSHAWILTSIGWELMRRGWRREGPFRAGYWGLNTLVWGGQE